ncbi:MAG: hypothetical protein LC785_07895 [Acidobacteria bacterium]|nr:hypothetical protein [Acidobacteriota bacterium]MCA1641855.1 hypothetical protein [Acidobacteriota bacterium]
MRWKLLVITSLAATVAGAGLCAALIYLLMVSTLRPGTTVSLVAATLALPLASITYATIFVYRHTARRRKLQAVLTASFTLLLIIGALLAAAIIGKRFLSRLQPESAPLPVSFNIKARPSRYSDRSLPARA